MAIVSRIYVLIGVQAFELPSRVEALAVAINGSREWIQVQYDNAATLGITEALDEWMLSQGYSFDAMAGINGIRVRQPSGTPIDIRVDAGGHLFASGFPPASAILKFSGAHAAILVGLATNFLADAGARVSALLLTARPRLPMPARTVKRLRVIAMVNPLVASMTVTVVKNGVATALAVTIPPGSTAQVSNLVDEVSFAAGDELDVSVASTSGGAAVAALAGTVEAL